MVQTLSSAGVNIIDANRLKVYPNPATDNISIAYDTQEETTFIIYDLTGRAVLETVLPAKATKINISVNHLSNAVYTYKQSIVGRILNTGKFVKED